MSDLGAQQPAEGLDYLADQSAGPSEPSPPPPPKGPRTLGLWVLLLSILLILSGGGYFVFRLVSDDGDKANYPKHWDSRILPYVKIVEKERELTFSHPVAVRFLDPKDFEKGVRSDDSDLSEKDRAELKNFTGMMRSLGLISGNIDLFKAFNDAHGSGTLAYYSYADQRVTIRGKVLTPAISSTLVHELTHALQDQRFDIGDRTKELQKKDDAGKSNDNAVSVFDAIIEGDATRIETKYRDSLPKKQQRALDRSQAKESRDANAELKKVPEVVRTLIGSPYTLGQSMLRAVDQKGGNAAVDELFVDPPTHELALIDPFGVVAGETGEIHVDLPKAPAGDKKFESGEFGALSLYLVLAERLPVKDALAAALGWGGDSSIAYDDKGTACVEIDYQGKAGTDTTTMFGALQLWTAFDPNPRTSVTRDGKLLRFKSCDPGTTGRAGRNQSQDAVELAAVRTYIGVAIMQAGGSTKQAGCTSAKLAQEYSVAQLEDPKFGANDPKVIGNIQKISRGCL